MAKQLRTVYPVWVLALIGAITIGLFESRDDYLQSLPIIMAVAILVTFCVQLVVAQKEGFVDRVMASIGGSIVILAAASLTYGLIALA